MSERTSSPPPANVIIEISKQLDNDTQELCLRYESIDCHGYQMLKSLDAMRKQRQLCDVILTAEGREYFAHRALLSCHSNYFLELFLNNEDQNGTKKQIYYQIDHVESIALKLILQFIYQGSFRFTKELIPKIYLTAYQLRMEILVKACSIYLREQLNEQNCLSTRLLAMDDELREQATKYIQTQFQTVLKTREFLTLSNIRVELIDLTMIKSKILFDLVLNWIIQEMRKSNRTLQDLCDDDTHLLFLNGETLQDCTAMDEIHPLYSDMIKDYRSSKSKKRHLSSTSSSGSNQENFLVGLLTFPFYNNSLLASLTIPETKLLHISQSNDHSYIGLAIINGKMLSISIYHSTPVYSPMTSDVSSAGSTDDSFVARLGHSMSYSEKDIPFGSLATARCCFGTVTIDDRIYVLGGYNRGDCLDTVEQFDPQQGQWAFLPSSFTNRRGRVSASSIQNRIYVCGGSDGQKELNTGEYFDFKSMTKWSMIKELPVAVVHSTMCSDKQCVYLIGGIEGDRCKNECYRYDPQENQWSSMVPMNQERSQAGVVYFEEKIYVFGGSSLNRCLSSCEIFTFATNQWTIGPAMKENRRGCGAALYHEKIFVVGGSNGVTSLTSVEIFDPKNNEWLVTINGISHQLNIPRIGLGVSVCCDRIYAIGGFDGRTFLKSVEVYDEQTQQWYLNHYPTTKLE